MSMVQSNFNSEDRKVIEQIPISSYYGKDFWTWHPSKSGSFSVKSAYKKALKVISIPQANIASFSFSPSSKCDLKSWYSA